jgi:hypothetical protein
VVAKSSITPNVATDRDGLTVDERFGRLTRSFEDCLRQGLAAERAIGLDLFDLGYWVQWPNPPINRKEDGSFRPNRPDLLVMVGDRPISIEVKSRSSDFAGPDDCRFDSVWVGKVRHWAERADNPHLIVVVSTSAKAGRLVIPCTTRMWWRQQVVDGEPTWGVPRRAWRSW